LVGSPVAPRSLHTCRVRSTLRAPARHAPRPRAPRPASPV